jgi:hypothetical protein
MVYAMNSCMMFFKASNSQITSLYDLLSLKALATSIIQSSILFALLSSMIDLFCFVANLIQGIPRRYCNPYSVQDSLPRWRRLVVFYQSFSGRLSSFIRTALGDV